MMQRRLTRIFLAAAVALLAAPAWAQTGYTVEGVEVSATASDATAARMEALEQGEAEAFRQLLQRLLPTSDEAERRAKSVASHQISRMVRGYDIRNERMTATSYSAKLDVNFDAAQVSRFLQGGQESPAGATPVQGAQATSNQTLPATPPPARFARQHMPNILVLPVWSADRSKPLLWEGGNVWRDAWNAAERTDTQFIRLPIGDQSDRMMVDGLQAMQAGYASLSPIAERYQSSTVIVAQASQTVSSGVNALSVTLRTLGQDGQTGEQPLTYEQRDGEDEATMMTRAAQDIIQRVMYTMQQQQAAQQQAAAHQQAQAAREAKAAERAQRPQQISPHAPRHRLTVLSRVKQLNDWVLLRRQLMQLPMVDRVDMAALSNQQVDLVVHYRGNAQQLEAAMQQQGIAVQKAQTYWVVEARP